MLLNIFQKNQKDMVYCFFLIMLKNYFPKEHLKKLVEIKECIKKLNELTLSFIHSINKHYIFEFESFFKSLWKKFNLIRKGIALT